MRNPGGVPRRVWAGEAGGAAMTAGAGDRADAPAADDGRATGWDPARVVLVVDDEASIVESLDQDLQARGPSPC
jgi:hypothetical protein